MGKSSSGKDTVRKKIQETMKMEEYVMYTTRPIRDGEKEGVDYFYISDEDMKKYHEDRKVIESRTYQTVKGPWTYATIDDGQFDSDKDILGVGTLESYKKVKEFFQNDTNKKLIPVYITIDEEEREKRARKREEIQAKPNYEEMERRLKADNIDFSEENLKRVGIGAKETFENYNLDECVENIIRYIQKEREQGLTLKEKYRVDVKPVEIKQELENKKEDEDKEL